MNQSAINKVGRGGYLPTKKISELLNGKEFKVTRVKNVSTKYGEKVVVHLEDQFQMFLPKRVSDAILADNHLLNQMNSADNLFLILVNSCIEFKDQCK